MKDLEKACNKSLPFWARLLFKWKVDWQRDGKDMEIVYILNETIFGKWFFKKFGSNA